MYKNTRVAYSSKGKGGAVILLHGFLENSSMWNKIDKELSQRNKVICIDLLGHGKSDCLGYVHAMEDLADVVKAVLKAERIRSVTLIGHSMGGYVALAFTEKYLKNIKGLCLLNSTAQADNEERKKLRLRAIKMAQTNYESLVSMSIVNLFAEDTRNQFLEEVEECKEVALKTSVHGYIACSEGMRMRINREHVLASKGFKKLIITGKKDSIINHKQIKEEAGRTQTPLITLSNGHMSHIENSKELISLLKDFIKSVG
ncbi:pimeloyl-ACP methyl ester carboxylesterase [Tenacibaculum adriaticum]|uniref:Pimeloyl-ACP methyl ester carboxylesterase n=2 Tax=Tenacibaculum adriaticum TaxID=413713 RepID=A0A5S5DYP6_9FLAO|nr:pimeloyl-ACP methyl ester carboxylesterase [Tenacibaculum adriaticum]